MADISKSEWHQGNLVAERLHLYLKGVAHYRRLDDYDDWYDSLEGFRSELSAFMKDDELEESRALLDKAKKFLKIPPSKRSAHMGKKIWRLRDELELGTIYLRKIMHKYGLDVPMSSTSGRGMAND